MSDVKTVDAMTSLDLYSQQEKDVAAMRQTLLSFNRTDPNAARKAIQNVTILRVYHQLERIVRYTEMIDKIEDKIYQSIDAKLMNSDPDDDSLWLTLIPMQERLQKMMIESHKLLEPYLAPEALTALDVPREEDPTASFSNMLLEQESREKVRTGVQELMNLLNTIDTTAQEADAKSTTVQSKAQEALNELTQGSDPSENGGDVKDA